MKYVIVGKNMEVTSSLEAAVKDKLGKLDKFFAEDTTAHVTLSINREKYKSKIVKKHKAQAAFKREYLEEPVAADEEIRIVRNKQFEMKPMYPEDACVQMELLGHAFYVFRNAETEQINVVYKRKGGAYGLIEPEE